MYIPTRSNADNIWYVFFEMRKNFFLKQAGIDTRVHTIIDDGRAYFSRAHNQYDVIVYGLLDAHTLLAPGTSGVRLDSYIYYT